MFRMPWSGSMPGWIRVSATFRVTIWIGALLLVVPTIRLALVQMAFSSQV